MVNINEFTQSVIVKNNKSNVYKNKKSNAPVFFTASTDSKRPSMSWVLEPEQLKIFKPSIGQRVDVKSHPENKKLGLIVKDDNGVALYPPNKKAKSLMIRTKYNKDMPNSRMSACEIIEERENYIVFIYPTEL